MDQSNRQIITSTTQQTNIMNCTTLLVICIILGSCCLSLSTDENFFNAMNVAMGNVIRSERYMDLYRQIGLNTDPLPCSAGEYPERLLKTNITACYKQGDTPIFKNLSIEVADMLLQELIRQYGSQVNMTVVPVNTRGSFFFFMSQAVITGSCDISVYANTLTPEREEVVSFLCPYATTRNMILRSELDPEMNITTAQQLNDTSVVIGVDKGTVYDQWVKANAALATVIYANSTRETLDLVAEQRVHVALYSEYSVQSWLKSNSDNCTNCSTHYYGEQTGLGAFVAPHSSANMSTHSSGMIFLLLACSIFATFW